MGFICTCLVVWGITQRGGDGSNVEDQGHIDSSSLLHKYNASILSFAIEPEEIQPGEIITAHWELNRIYDENLYLYIPHVYYPSYKWTIDNPFAGIFTFTIPITLMRDSPFMIELYNGPDHTYTLVPLVCDNAWFFEPRSSHCPGKIRRMRAWQQDFEYGTIIRFEGGASFTGTNSYSLGKNGYTGPTQSQISKEMIGDKENFGDPVGPEREFWACYAQVYLRYNNNMAYFNDADSQIISVYITRWSRYSRRIIEGNFIDCDQGEQG